MAIILAAGKGKRMHSALPKVLHPAMGKPMLAYVVDAVKGAGVKDLIVVVGKEAGKVKDVIGEEGISYALQDEPLGTAHAVMAARDLLEGSSGTALILCGDTPLLEAGTLSSLLDHHRREEATLTILAALMEDPRGYGRILRGEEGEVLGVIEESDATEEQRAIKEINSGIYAVQIPFLLSALDEIGRDNAQGEYYLTDIVEIAHRRGEKIAAFRAPSPQEVMGVNTRADLARAQKLMARRIVERWMASGVTIEDPETTYIEAEVEIGQDTLIRPFSFLRGKTVVGRRCTLGPQVEIVDSRLGDEVTVRFCSLIEGSEVERGAVIGPFSRLRPETYIGEGARIGNFVEVKKSRIGRGSKANHLTYIGDAQVGAGVNIGAGTITCNYDGFQKNPTLIEDGAFIGSNVALVAPVKVGKEAVVGAGSVITRNVPSLALAVERSRQKHLKKWVLRRKKREEG